MNCSEIFQSDIVKVVVYKASDLTTGLPWSVPGIQSMTPPEVKSGASPLLTLELSTSDETVVQMETEATLKVSQSRKQAGLLYSHKVSVSVQEGFVLIDKAVQEAQGNDLIYIYTHGDGTQSMSLGCPGTSQLSMTEDRSANKHEGSLEMELTSMSGVITLVNG